MRRRDTRLTYATSISVADGKAMFVLAADWARRFYAAQASNEDADQPPDGEDKAAPDKAKPAPH
jgi:hypothetical protein